MTKQEFLALLESRLDVLGQSDILRTLSYYSEMIDDRMEDGMSEEAAIEDLGSMDDLVAQILRDTPRAPFIPSQPTPKQPRSRKDTAITVLCVICGCIVIGFALVEIFLFMRPYFLPFGDIDFQSHFAGDNTIQITESFSAIEIRTVASISVGKSEDETCRVEMTYGEDEVPHTATVENNTLIIQPEDEAAFDDIYYPQCDMTVEVFLPKDSYEKISAESTHGDVGIGAIAFTSAELKSEAGEIACDALVTGDLDITGSSGEIYIYPPDDLGDLTVRTESGDVTIRPIWAKSLTIQTASGNVLLDQGLVSEGANIETGSGNIAAHAVVMGRLTAKTGSGEIELTASTAEGEMELESVSGDIRVDESDAAGLKIQSDSGDVTGTLLNEKQFIVETDSGAVSVQNTPSAEETCQVTTVSGDILLGVK